MRLGVACELQVIIPPTMNTDHKQVQQDQEPELDAPGAGVPWLEKKLMGIGLRMYAGSTDRVKALAKFQTGAEELLALAEPLDEATGRKRVLVPRLRAMEDSSRFWSPYMIIQHVTIIDRGVLLLIRALSAGKPPGPARGTADVKPSPDAGPETIAAFRETAAEWQKRIGAIPDLKTALKQPHPWFGKLDGHQWLCVAALHHDIHLKQMAHVLKGARTP